MVLALSLFSGVQSAPFAEAALVVAPNVSVKTPVPTMANVISDSKRKNKKAHSARVAKLKKSTALVSIIKKAAPKRLGLYLDFFAAASTAKMVDKLVKKTKGKYFRVTGTPRAPKAKLLPGKGPVVLLSADVKCPEGWIAIAAWELGVGMLCAGAGAAAGGAALPSIIGVIPAAGATAAICGAFFIWLQNQFIDFNSTCARPLALR